MSRPQNNQEYKECTIPDNDTKSTGMFIAPIGPRGLAVQVPDGWDDADIYFQVSRVNPTGPNDDAAPTDDADWIYLRDSSGAIVKITGIQTSAAGLYVAPGSVWPVGTYPWLRLVSSAAQNGGERSLEVALLG